MLTSPPEIRLHVEPGVVQSWDEFRRTRPPCSIALDGFVDAAPTFCPSGPYANFDHHANVNRLATRSTVGQVLMAVSLGLFETFRREGEPFANVYVNDCDQDVCLAVWLLSHAHLVTYLRLEMDVARLIIGEDLIDASAGAYPVDPTRPISKRMAWTFELYEQARTSGRLRSMSPEEMAALIKSTCDRITELACGRGQELPLVGAYEVIGGGEGWKLVREEGTFARTRLYADGIRAFVAVRDREEGVYDYSIGRMSHFIPFPVPGLIGELNRAEGRVDSADKWGGSDTIGGSPRMSGSRLPPGEVERIINQHLEAADHHADTGLTP